MTQVQLYCADCLEKLRDIPTGTVDAVITDSPYPCIKRDYGYWTVEEWWELVVEGVVPQVRRILKPTGSAVFILQPNSKHVGQMRGWLWRFMYWVTENWNQVQDVWWWNFTMFPTSHPLRCSLKACVWAGAPDCYRDQDQILWSESQANLARRMHGRWGFKYSPSRTHNNQYRASLKAQDRGGVTPFNVIPLPPGNSVNDAGAHGHGAGTPLRLADWWTRYICPPGGTVCDPFMGSGTMGVAAVNNGCNFIGIEKLPGPKYFETAQKRIQTARKLALRTAGKSDN